MVRQSHPPAGGLSLLNHGGEGGIRTLEGLATLQTFQVCLFDRSSTSPQPSILNFRLPIVNCIEGPLTFSEKDGTGS